MESLNIKIEVKYMAKKENKCCFQQHSPDSARSLVIKGADPEAWKASVLR